MIGFVNKRKILESDKEIDACTALSMNVYNYKNVTVKTITCSVTNRQLVYETTLIVNTYTHINSYIDEYGVKHDFDSVDHIELEHVVISNIDEVDPINGISFNVGDKVTIKKFEIRCVIPNCYFMNLKIDHLIVDIPSLNTPFIKNVHIDRVTCTNKFTSLTRDEEICSNFLGTTDVGNLIFEGRLRTIGSGGAGLDIMLDEVRSSTFDVIQNTEDTFSGISIKHLSLDNELANMYTAKWRNEYLLIGSCESIDTLTIEHGVTEIRSGLDNKNIKGTLFIPNTVTRIGKRAFAGNSFSTIIFEEGGGYLVIEEKAFEDNTIPLTVKLPSNQLTRLHPTAFIGCKFDSFVVPKECKVQWGESLGYCKKLTGTTEHPLFSCNYLYIKGHEFKNIAMLDIFLPVSEESVNEDGITYTKLIDLLGKRLFRGTVDFTDNVYIGTKSHIKKQVRVIQDKITAESKFSSQYDTQMIEINVVTSTEMGWDCVIGVFHGPVPDDESLNGEYCHVTTVSIPLNYRIEDGDLILAETDHKPKNDD